MSPDTERLNVVLSGLTAAGKTTHALRLRSELGYRYVSGLGVLARLCGVDTDDPPIWADIAEAIGRVRSDRTDREVERELARLSTNVPAQVFDARALSWTSSESSLVRIWIDSTVETRAWKAYISQGEEPSRDLDECLAFIEAKDKADRNIFQRTFGFDLFRDRGHFHAVLDNTGFITAPTPDAAEAGIAAFAPIVSAVVAYCHGELSEDELAAIDERSPFGPAVIRCSPVIRS